MNKPSCSQLRTKLLEIINLKAEFDLELSNIKTTRNTAPALKLEEDIREKIRFIRESLFLIPLEWAEITIGTKSKEELIKELEDRKKSDNPEDKIHITSWAQSMLESPDFIVINKPEKVTLVRLKVQDLGFEQEPTTDEVYKRVQELGLELCPPEIGPYLRLNYEEVFQREQVKGEALLIGMKQIIDSYGAPSVFSVLHNNDGKRWLDQIPAKPQRENSLKRKFVFIRK